MQLRRKMSSIFSKNTKAWLRILKSSTTFILFSETMQSKSTSSPGFFITKTQAILIVLLFIVACVGIGLMAGLIPDRGSDEIVLLPGEQDGNDDPESQGPWLELRLPSAIKPTRYDLWLNPDFYFEGNTFSGREDISLQVLEDTNYVLIHFKLMEITRTELSTSDGRHIDIVQTFAYEPHEFWVIETAETLRAGTDLVLHLEFNGSLVNGIVGYYKSTYVNSDTGIERYESSEVNPFFF